MTNDSALRSALLWLAVVVVVVGIWTRSWKKMTVTYFVGVTGIAGVLLPDWEYFDRDVSQWLTPLTVDNITPQDVQRPLSTRFRFYPIRTVLYATVYCLALYKWWTYVAH